MGPPESVVLPLVGHCFGVRHCAGSIMEAMNADGLFSSFVLRGVTLSNRIVVSPMCQYSCVDGFATDWHLVHLGSRAVGGAGLIFCEATAVVPEGRISPDDLGIWKDEHVPKLRQIVEFLHSQGSRAGIQLAHAGRKASTFAPGKGDGAVSAHDGGWWDVMAPSAVPFSDKYPAPVALDGEGLQRVVAAFADGARRSADAGFDVIELHGAHGYLLHQFLSPLSNLRTDRYGGGFENRTRLLLEIVEAVQRVWTKPLMVRLSATDWAEGGWNIGETVRLAGTLRERGVDLVDVSSGGLVPGVLIPLGAGYQTPFAERVRREAGIPTGAVGMITDAAQADHIIRTGQADLVFIARELLRDPYWPMHAAGRLGQTAEWPVQYLRAAPRGSLGRTLIE